ncbi:S1C family serine protease [Treponema sp. OMZ 857]|uniref:S1C family serine protease n=1 Tax=Treponema sp. OMZ 857 TaxID=1643513 RepID=UPI0020A4070A|nr:S1C family serine protease [Treponema sp. OMZ 857]UTC44214.1 trypsin-like serine protease [Treponema sp. OMZ 857]
MKNKIICLLFFLSVTAAFADIRNAVCIVRPNYSEKTAAFMEDASGQLEKTGYSDLAELFKNAKEGVFGSGFFIKGQNKKDYVLTNYHVAAYAASLTLEIEDTNGETTKIENCNIIAVDEELDLAIAEVPSGKVDSYLTFASKTPVDGIDVWSAGYPGLAGKPMWQLGKGTVTNARARLPDDIDPKISTFIQHSAPIDSGNSGGPLLVKAVNAPSGYEIIGINSAKAVFRQATNFAIPASTITKFMDEKVFAGNKKIERDLTASLNIFAESCKNFKIEKESDKNKEIVKRIRKLTVYVSEDYAIQSGLDVYLKALRRAPKLFRNEILAASIFGNPINGIRTALAYDIYITIDPEENTYLPDTGTDINSLKKTDNGYEFVLYDEVQKSKFFTVWKKSYNSWQMDGASLNEPPQSGTGSKDQNKKSAKKDKKAAGKSSIFIEEIPTTMRIPLSYIGFSRDGRWRSAFSFGFFYSFKYAEVGMSAIIDKPRDGISSFSPSQSGLFSFTFGLCPELKGQIPININNVLYIAPQAFVGVGLFIPPIDTFVHYGAGVEFVPAGFTTLSFGADFIARTYLKKPNITNHGVRINVSIRF